jgi:hypothetical protein
VFSAGYRGKWDSSSIPAKVADEHELQSRLLKGAGVIHGDGFASGKHGDRSGWRTQNGMKAGSAKLMLECCGVAERIGKAWKKNWKVRSPMAHTR